MALVSSYTQQLANSTNCRYAYKAYLQGATAVCKGMVSSTLVSATCFGILASLSFVLLLLDCSVWSMYQKGRYDASKYMQIDDDSDGGSSDENEGYSRGQSFHQSPDDIEMEMYRPLDPRTHMP